MCTCTDGWEQVCLWAGDPRVPPVRWPSLLLCRGPRGAAGQVAFPAPGDIYSFSGRLFLPAATAWDSCSLCSGHCPSWSLADFLEASLGGSVASRPHSGGRPGLSAGLLTLAWPRPSSWSVSRVSRRMNGLSVFAFN